MRERLFDEAYVEVPANGAAIDDTVLSFDDDKTGHPGTFATRMLDPEAASALSAKAGTAENVFALSRTVTPKGASPCSSPA